MRTNTTISTPHHDGNRCDCKAPAEWMLKWVSIGRHGQQSFYHAACTEHLAAAYDALAMRALLDKKDPTTNGVITLRRDA
jgi:hypothetical protein